MYEIELKAHIEDHDNVVNKLDSFAKFLEKIEKDDVYWGILKDDKKIQARIRKENITYNNEETEQKFVLTYKRKENRLDSNGKSYEVNDEKECEISDYSALESLFTDLGMNVVLKKHKDTIGYQFGECHIEVCNVPPLGEFLEIEIISEKNDEETVAEKRTALLDILKRCEISEDKIEKRYYSEMLREVSSTNQKGEKNV